MDKQIIFCDVDDVVAALTPRWIELYNAAYDDTLQHEAITSWNLLEFVKPECGAGIYNFLHWKTLYDEVRPIAGALDGVRELRDFGFRVVFATSCNQHMAGLKMKWLHEHGFIALDQRLVCKDYIEISDKHLLRGHALVDDYHVNLNGFHGLRVMFRQPHNDAISPAAFPHLRAADWPAVVDELLLNR